MRSRSDLLILCAVLGVTAMSLNACAGQTRIKPSRVTIKNHEQFMAQFKRDLPVGTPAQDVMTYLENNEILHGYRPPGSFGAMLPSFFKEDGYDRRVGFIQGRINKISNALFVFRTDLYIKIYISEEEKVLEIKHGLSHTFL